MPRPPPYCRLQVEQRQSDGRWITGAAYPCTCLEELHERLAHIATREDMRPIGLIVNGVLIPMDLSTGFSLPVDSVDNS
ncbi:hypothetical protein [Deinococcus peraridilitoris]|uniref:Uncharacterized protein n=1 Tax=Deinococcus peraridilitoris (strain DSM 19664 / LMG 22246 / CIP 109416 / KR-200) TaxID=937777 RepID=L0A3N6_DEIPD|nr:hypothetical protein [Deinococcus peraridilitoris]AFZ67600.1 hypothetical protein Deipe_2105 [Deinococcus peraridilitoris DSM 19664]